MTESAFGEGDAAAAAATTAAAAAEYDEAFSNDVDTVPRSHSHHNQYATVRDPQMKT